MGNDNGEFNMLNMWKFHKEVTSEPIFWLSKIQLVKCDMIIKCIISTAVGFAVNMRYKVGEL